MLTSDTTGINVSKGMTTLVKFVPNFVVNKISVNGLVMYEAQLTQKSK